jgi:hypothetical protein
MVGHVVDGSFLDDGAAELADQASNPVSGHQAAARILPKPQLYLARHHFLVVRYALFPIVQHSCLK